MAADFGPGFLAQDRAARLFLYRGDMDAEWAAYGISDAREITQAFVDGINAWIAQCAAEPDLLPPEFAATETCPEPWAAEDVVRIRTHGRVRNVLSEVARAQILSRAGQDADRMRQTLEPDWTPLPPEGVDLSEIPANVLDVFKLATAVPDFSPARMAAKLDDAWRWSKVSELGDVTMDGSNNWVISPGRTATGRPILAGDPHRNHSLPSLRSIVHLTCPGLDVIGAGEPSQPGVSMGHNGTAAFGLTIFPMDQEDLYVYECRGNSYRYGEDWEDFRVETETIAVLGADPQTAELKFTRHGPVVFETGNRAYAVRTVWTAPGAAPYFAGLGYLGAATPESFSEALRHWKSPSVNHAYADISGRIAWYVAGAAPIRPNWDGLLPVPGDGRYEWQGFQPFDALPHTVDPACGYIATANEYNLTPDYRHSASAR
jgi:penicillin amidase